MRTGCALMRNLSRHFVLLALVLLKLSYVMPYLRDNGKELSRDFMNFVEEMSSMVYKHGQNKAKDYQKRPTVKFVRVTTPQNKLKQQDSILSTQRAALRDVLMMKLVSYYEDKYKVSHDIIPSIKLTTTVPFVYRRDTYPQNRNHYETAAHYLETSTPVAEVIVI